ncbi:MAG TPA: thiamine-phosphate kinase [Polyangiaceae bacterium]|nr:thiamine-phosphate kinase [Polyangiaceae bacterium]
MKSAAPREWRALELLRSRLDPAQAARTAKSGKASGPSKTGKPGKSGKPGGVVLGIGDDCAVLAPLGQRSVWTTDACLENVHFRLDWASPADVAHKSLNAAVSDVAAMGARPLAALSHVTLSPRLDERALRSFARAQAAAAAELGCPIIGGNLAHGREFQVVTSVLGVMKGSARASKAVGPEPLLRSGARPGDEIWLVGELGMARVGLELLQAGRRVTEPLARACVRAQLRPRALVELGPRLLGRATACLDVSDGLVGDADHLAGQSGVALRLEAERLETLVSPAFEKLCRSLGHGALEALLQGGEDYALLATGPRARRPRFAKVLGRVERGRGVTLERAGVRVPLRGGFEHGAR